MYGRIFETMFEGSLVGSKPIVWAVWGYVIAKQRRDRIVGSQVRLNSELLRVIFGTTEKEVEGAIEFLCKPDAHSSSKEKGGRRLVKLGEFEYQVVNGAKYMAVRDEEDRRRQNREAQRRFRGKGSRLGLDGPPTGQATSQRLADGGATPEEVDRHEARILEEQEENRKKAQA